MYTRILSVAAIALLGFGLTMATPALADEGAADNVVAAPAADDGAAPAPAPAATEEAAPAEDEKKDGEDGGGDAAPAPAPDDE